MTSPLISAHTADAIATITINRPERRNALTLPMYTMLADALATADNEPSARVIVLTGAANYFTAGNDIADFIGFTRDATQEFPALTFLKTLAGLKNPIVAAVEGGAIGVGATLLQHCDFVYAGRSTKFSFPFTNFGLPLEGGVSLALAQGPLARQVARWIYLGDPFTPDEALAAGLITQVVDDGAALATAHGVATRLAAISPASIQASKAMIKAGKPTMQQTMVDEVEHFTKLLESAPTQAALKAFFERSGKK
jgi:enoyl-CoA hydratase/carnithine racemase